MELQFNVFVRKNLMQISTFQSSDVCCTNSR